MFTLRSYQQRACDAALDWMRSSVSPCLIDAAPAAGKSYMVAYIANALHKMSAGKRVLCLMPNSTLVSQNTEKYRLTGEPCSVFSATAGAKSTRHPVVMATAGTVKNAISRFNDGQYCAVILDEAHAALTPTILTIIEAMQAGNPNLRVLGLTGTPYRLGSGYIFRQWPDGRANGDDTCRKPYFVKCVYRVTAKEMLDEQFITPMDIGAIGAQEYDTSGVILLPNGTLDQGTVERAFVGHGRKTAAIVGDVVAKSQGRYGGTMLFGSTVAHAREIMASLPPLNSGMVTGTDCVLMGKPATLKQVVDAYKAQRIKYITSVGQLTTGFDTAHTSTICLLRYSESAALLQQILGRSWRLDPLKSRSLLLDYAGNVERHFEDGDIYNPAIRASGAKEGGQGIEAECPECGHSNFFSGRPDTADYQLDKHGYCLDVFGEPIKTDYGPMPGHFGRRCFGMVRVGSRGEYDRCGYFWTSKECGECGGRNDIAARRCRECKAELIDPNEKLAIEFKAMKRDPSRPQTDKVVSVTYKPSVSRAGNPTLRCDWVTEYRQMSVWLTESAKHPQAKRDWALFQAATNETSEVPETISYMKTPEGFWRILGYNEPADTLETFAA
jgi:DNA repair protein RadD